MNVKELKTAYLSMLKERIENYGTSALTDEELISSLTGIPVEELQPHIKEHGLVDLVKIIDSIKLTKIQRNKLIATYELLKRIYSQQKQFKKIDSSTLAGEFFVNDLQFESNEVFKMLVLDNQNRIIRLEQLSEGTVAEAPIFARKILQILLNLNAAKVIFAHNHPGGSLRPSQPDLDSTKTLCQACKLCQIAVVDHVIVADDRYVSLAEEGLLPDLTSPKI